MNINTSIQRFIFMIKSIMINLHFKWLIVNIFIHRIIYFMKFIPIAINLDNSRIITRILIFPFYLNIIYLSLTTYNPVFPCLHSKSTGWTLNPISPQVLKQYFHLNIELLNVWKWGLCGLRRASVKLLRSLWYQKTRLRNIGINGNVTPLRQCSPQIQPW